MNITTQSYQWESQSKPAPAPFKSCTVWTGHRLGETRATAIVATLELATTQPLVVFAMQASADAAEELKAHLESQRDTIS